MLDLHVPLPIAVARMLERQTCVSCEAPYGPKVPPAPDARCTACGGEVIHRHDDTLESMGRRLAVWDVEGRRIMRYYEAKTTVVRIDATREPTVVAAEVIHHIRAAALGVAEASAGF
ncbi:MAG TPA: hypothetical protein VES97_05800 [Solirubrobacteraceae bacterium]|nr:hypothetical protein [Solirubrobacteraceae bacterium]